MRSLRIMVIDDYDTLREAICEVLSEEGHEVVGVASAEHLDDVPVGFTSDLYIIDINLPGEDGTSLATRLRKSQPDVGIILVSASHALTDRIGGYTSGANLYLTKPLALEELCAVVSGIAQRRNLDAVEVSQSIILHSQKLKLTGPTTSVAMTQAETALVAAFSRATQQTLEHWQVASHLGQGKDLTKENLEVKLGRLRKKLIACGAEAPAVRSIRGVGYRLCVSILVLSD